MYSAKKIAGRKLYELARRGEEVERQAVRVTVSEFEATALPMGVFFLLQAVSQATEPAATERTRKSRRRMGRS